MSSVTLEQANVIIDAAVRSGPEMGLAPLTVDVLDAANLGTGTLATDAE